METPGAQLVKLFEEKLSLYRDLIEVLKSERLSIMSAHTDQLWQLSDNKQKIVSMIESLRERILEALRLEGITHDMTVTSFRPSRVMALVSSKNRKVLLPLQGALNSAKEEIQLRSRENATFIEESLNTVDELIGIFMGKNDDGFRYDRHRQIDGMRSRSLVHQEV